MDEGNSFLDSSGGCAGDQSAAVELVRRYEPAVRRVVRLQMRDPRLRRILDSMDVCQSVLASFFLRAATGQYDLNQPAQLLRLLAVMARNKVASQARTSYVTRRERPFFGAEEAWTTALAPGPGPDRQAAWKDLLQEVRTGCPRTNGGWRIVGRSAESGPISRPNWAAARKPFASSWPAPWTAFPIN